MDITKLTLCELKALAYDELVKQNTCNANLQIINAEIQKKINVEQENTTKDK